MVVDPAAAGVVTVLFCGSSLFAVRRLTRAHSPVTRTNYVLHVAMGVAMVAMAWARSWQTVPQMVVFGVATAWFLGRVLRVVSGRDHRRIAFDAYHAAMMAAMVLMLAQMSGTPLAHDHHAVVQSYGPLAVSLTAIGWALALACLAWAGIGLRRLTGSGPSRLRARLVGDSLYELAMALGMAVMILAAH